MKENFIENSKSSVLKNIIEWLLCIIIAVLFALLFRYFIGTPTIVKKISMYPTLVENERLWLSKWNKTTKTLAERGDIITFEAPSKIFYSESDIQKNLIDKSNPIAKYENEPSRIFDKFTYYVLELGKESYIKRVIGLPGEHIEIKDEKVFINGEEFDEPYLQSGIVTDVAHMDSRTGFNDFIVPDNCVFAMGDNRPNSTDCRDFGCIPLEKIEGKVILRIWPLNDFGKVF